MELEKVYVLQYAPDRRRQSVPVEKERRSGKDRRKSPRLAVNSKIRQEILENNGQKPELARIYNLEYLKDRRQKNIPVETERRSGTDRRTTPRFDIDSKLKKDLASFKPQAKSSIQSDCFTNSGAATPFKGGPILDNSIKAGIQIAEKTAAKSIFGTHLKSLMSALSIKTFDPTAFKSTDQKEAVKAITSSAFSLSGCATATGLAYCLLPHTGPAMALLAVASGIIGGTSGYQVAKRINKHIK